MYNHYTYTQITTTKKISFFVIYKNWNPQDKITILMQ